MSDSGKLWDAQDANAAKTGVLLNREARLEIFLTMLARTSILKFGSVKAAERFMQQFKEMYDHALSRINEELSCREKELEKLSMRLRESDTRSTQKEKESSELRATLEGALREKAALVEQNDSQIRRLNVEILGLRKQSEVVTSELALTHDLLKDARKEIGALVVAKSELKGNVATYLKDAAMMNQIAHDVSIKAEQKLARAIEHARAEARRKTLQEIEVEGVDLSDGIEEARELETKLTLLIILDEDPGDGSEGSGDEE
ncbi:GRIP domain-containing protein RUD3-like [Nicotiana sylvestris]|uniref:GRIP domain-containing protein RUD3-like n=1 Tax=Nicotiana sylvestris TaxID=4096 RepID=UPI00388CD5D5